MNHRPSHLKRIDRFRKQTVYSSPFLTIFFLQLLFLLPGCITIISQTEDQDSHQEYIFQKPKNRNLAVFVHGFKGNPTSTWGSLPKLIKNDKELKDFDLLFWGYPSHLFKQNVNINTIGRYLKTEIDHTPQPYDRIVLIGHSIGGLVIRAYIVDALLNEKGNDLKNIDAILLFGTPNDGLEVARYVPEFVNDQIADIRVVSDLIIQLRQVWVKRVINAEQNDNHHRKIPTLAISGIEDKFVPEASAKSYFKNTATTKGNHISMVKPKDTQHPTYRIIKKRLLAVKSPPSIPAQLPKKNLREVAGTRPARNIRDLVGTWQFTKSTTTTGKTNKLPKSLVDMGFVFRKDGTYDFHNYFGQTRIEDEGTFTIDSDNNTLKLGSTITKPYVFKNLFFFNENTFTTFDGVSILTWKKRRD